jgi:hypothetical protein
LPGAERDQIALSYDCGDSIEVEDYLELENKAVDLDTVDEHLNGGMVRGHDPVDGQDHELFTAGTGQRAVCCFAELGVFAPWRFRG